VTEADIDAILSRGKDLSAERASALTDKEKKGLLDFSSTEFAYKNFEGEDFSKQARRTAPRSRCGALRSPVLASSPPRRRSPPPPAAAAPALSPSVRARVSPFLFFCFVFSFSVLVFCFLLFCSFVLFSPFLFVSFRCLLPQADLAFVSAVGEAMGKRDRTAAIYTEREPRGFSAAQAASLLPRPPKMRRIPEMRDFQLYNVSHTHPVTRHPSSRPPCRRGTLVSRHALRASHAASSRAASVRHAPSRARSLRVGSSALVASAIKRARARAQPYTRIHAHTPAIPLLTLPISSTLPSPSLRRSLFSSSHRVARATRACRPFVSKHFL
jgi:hypothetical protein